MLTPWDPLSTAVIDVKRCETEASHRPERLLWAAGSGLIE
jgi:hypothetical protein